MDAASYSARFHPTLSLFSLNMVWIWCLWNREYLRMDTCQKVKGNLPWCFSMALCIIFKQSPFTIALWTRGKQTATMSKRRVSDHSYFLLCTVWEYTFFYAAIAQVVQNLVAYDLLILKRRFSFLQFSHSKVADSNVPYYAICHELFHCLHGFTNGVGTDWPVK